GSAHESDHWSLRQRSLHTISPRLPCRSSETRRAHGGMRRIEPCDTHGYPCGRWLYRFRVVLAPCVASGGIGTARLAGGSAARAGAAFPTLQRDQPAHGEDQRKRGAIGNCVTHVRLGCELPVEVQQREHARGVDQHVESLPAAAEASYPAACG